MPTQTFLALASAKRTRIVEEAISEFSERTYGEASLSAIVRRLGIAKGSIYQYFADKRDLYCWLVTEEVPRRKQAYSSEPAATARADFWERLRWRVERGIAFLVEHPRLARLTAASADPSADPEIRGLHRAVCEESYRDLRAFIAEGVKAGALPRATDLTLATSVVTAVIGPGLTDIILRELGAELHQVLSDDELRNRIDTRMRKKLARKAVATLRDGLGT